MKNYISINLTGQAHIFDKKDCEDAVFARPEKSVFCLADGVSNSLYGREGARAVVDKIGEMFCFPSFIDCLAAASTEEIRQAVCDAVDATLLELCSAYHTDNPHHFASTFMACIRAGDSYIILHAGDGCVFAKPNTRQDSSVMLVSGPDNSISGAVYCVGHPDSRYRMRVIRLFATDLSGILLCTDGFSDAYLNPSGQHFDITGLNSVFRCTGETQLLDIINIRHLTTCKIKDDISCLLFKPDAVFARSKSPCPDLTSKETFATDTDKAAQVCSVPENVAAPGKTSKSDHLKKWKPVWNPRKSGIIFVTLAFVIVMLLFSYSNVLLVQKQEELSQQISSLSDRLTNRIIDLEDTLDRLEKAADAARSQDSSDSTDNYSADSAGDRSSTEKTDISVRGQIE